MNDKEKMNEEKNFQNLNQFRQPRKPFSLWKYIIVFFAAWFIFSYTFQWYGNESRVNISYSEFRNQVKKNNVDEVLIKGQEVTGKFNKEYLDITQIKNEKSDTTTYQFFSTTLPPFENKDLTEFLENHNVTINAEVEDSSNWWTYLLIILIPWILIIGYIVYMRKKMQGKMGNMFGGGKGILGIGKSRAKKFQREKADVTFDDVAGLKNAKADLSEIIDYLKSPDKYSKLGADIPKGILLMGPPGTGKTLLARATAGEADVSFYSISGSEFIEMFVGVGASRVRDLFDRAKKEAPSVIFIDEIDSIGRARGTGLGGGHDEREQTLNQILSEMDGFEPNSSVVVMAATNRPDVLDTALTRPGRFDRRVTLELPQREAREKILEIHTRKVTLGEDVDLGNIASRTVSFSGADLENLVNEAALLAGRKEKDKVENEDFDEARDKILLGAEREEKINDEEKHLIAYHEGGHALLAKLLPDTDPLQKVTIIPRGRSLGVTEQVPEIERHNLKRNYLLNRIAVTLGGRAAEKIKFDDFSNGAANDLKQVTKLARKMVCQWGMSDKLGPVYFRQGEEHLFLGKEMAQQKDFSEETARIIDEEIQRIINEQMEKAIDTLKENEVKLDAIADGLIENETLENEQIDWILDKVEKGEKE